MKDAGYLSVKGGNWRSYFVVLLLLVSTSIISQYPVPMSNAVPLDTFQVNIVAVTPPDGSSIGTPEHTFSVTVAYSGATASSSYHGTSFGAIQLNAFIYTPDAIALGWVDMMGGNTPMVDNLSSSSGVVDLIWRCDTSWITNTSDILHTAIDMNSTVQYLFSATGYSANWAQDTDDRYVNYSVAPSGPVPMVTLSPSSGQPGSACTVTGSGFTPGETIQLTWESLTGTSLGTPIANSTGQFSTQMTIPQTAPPGTYSLYATGTSTKTYTTYMVDEPLTAYFELTACERTVTDSLLATFDATGSIPEQDIMVYQWDFGDGNTEQTGWGQLVVINEYAQPGDYTVSLTVKDTHGNTNTSIQLVAIEGWAIVDTCFCVDVMEQEPYDPINRKQLFFFEDNITVWLKFVNLTNPHNIRFDWYAPDGTFLVAQEVITPNASQFGLKKLENHVVYATISRTDALYPRMMRDPGACRVTISVDGIHQFDMICTIDDPFPGILDGILTDGHGNPLSFATLTVTFTDKTYQATTESDGSYVVFIDNFIPLKDNPQPVTLNISFSYMRDGKNYFTIIDDSAGGNLVMFEKHFMLVDAANATQDIDFKITASVGVYTLPTSDGTITSNSMLRNLHHFATIYFHTHQAVDFALNHLRANIDYKLPVDVRVAGTQGTKYRPSSSTIFINITDSHYGSTDRPDNREYHEFSHHIMYAMYGSWPTDPPGTVNHNGYINPGTGDSYTEGFAEFMAMVISEYQGDVHPELYAGVSLENNYKAFHYRGKAEEFAICGILWDLYDNKIDKGDRVDLTLGQMWSILKFRRDDFFEYYKAFIQAFPDKEDAINNIFIAHGFFVDKNRGNQKRDKEEPYIDENKNKQYDKGERFVDYGIPTGFAKPYLIYDQGEEVGRATNYHRVSRSMAVRLPNAYLKVNDTEVRLYQVIVNFTDGKSYDYVTDVREGKIYVMPPPEDDNAIITIKPYSTAYEASQIYTISMASYLKQYYHNSTSETGYFDGHTFILVPTGNPETMTYETVNDVEQTYKVSYDEFGGERYDTPPDDTEKTPGFTLILFTLALIGILLIDKSRKES